MDEKPSKAYLIADTHFLHDKMGFYCGRPDDFGKKIINQWQNTVKPHDLVYHLGDVIWGTRDQLTAIMKDLPGVKILIRGNHDKNHSNNWFLTAGFAAVLEKAQVSGVILSHWPAVMNQAEINRGLINVHGHFHNNPVRKWEKNLVERITPSHYLLSLEEVHYRPVPLNDVIRRKWVKNSHELVLKSES